MLTLVRRSWGTTLRIHHRLWPINRLIGKLDAWRCRLLGKHTVTDGDWGYGMKGMVDLYCPHCLQIVRRVPLDDFSSLDDLFFWLDQARSP